MQKLNFKMIKFWCNFKVIFLSITWRQNYLQSIKMTECVPAHWRFYSVKMWPRNCESVKFPSLAASMTPTRIALTNRVDVNPTVKIIVFPLGTPLLLFRYVASTCHVDLITCVRIQYGFEWSYWSSRCIYNTWNYF